jgi:TfoX/Sxy family transcriptional regulator of competence genes
MAFDGNLAARIRTALARKKNIDEKKMFGCICFFLNGNALVGVWKDRLIARLGPDEGEVARLEPHVGEFNITGKPMRNWVTVEPEGVADEEAVKDWVQRAIKFVGKMPAKKKKGERHRAKSVRNK